MGPFAVLIFAELGSTPRAPVAPLAVWSFGDDAMGNTRGL
jgi:hypothetical protein